MIPLTLKEITVLITEIGILLGFVIPVLVTVYRVSNGQRCLLRSEMLHIYYRHRDKGTIRQYEYENFVMLYEAYKALKGNSFIDKIYKEVQELEVIT